MGMFFNSPAGAVGALETELQEAVETLPPVGADAGAEVARRVQLHASKVRSAVTALQPNVKAFAAAAIVFIFLLVVAYATANAADAGDPNVASQMRDLSGKVQGLLEAWSGAVLGLIAGEAVGKKAP